MIQIHADVEPVRTVEPACSMDVAEEIQARFVVIDGIVRKEKLLAIYVNIGVPYHVFEPERWLVKTELPELFKVTVKVIPDNAFFLRTGDEYYPGIDTGRNGKAAHEVLLKMIVITKITDGINDVIR